MNYGVVKPVAFSHRFRQAPHLNEHYMVTTIGFTSVSLTNLKASSNSPDLQKRSKASSAKPFIASSENSELQHPLLPSYSRTYGVIQCSHTCSTCQSALSQRKPLLPSLGSQRSFLCALQFRQIQVGRMPTRRWREVTSLGLQFSAFIVSKSSSA